MQEEIIHATATDETPAEESEEQNTWMGDFGIGKCGGDFHRDVGIATGSD